MEYKGMLRATQFIHQFLKNVLQEGNNVVDGTMGNGHDTLFLAKMIGTSGKVFSFDIQEDAIMNTKARLLENGITVGDHIHLILDGHENIEKYITEPIDAAMFNLGYLPGGDHSIITKPETTISAISSVLKKLRKGGVVTIVIYYGHEGGSEEKNDVLTFLKGLEHHHYTVMYCNYVNQGNSPPIIVIIEKR